MFYNECVRPSKLSPEQLAELKELYVHDGWHVIELARKFNMHHTSVVHYTNKLSRQCEPRQLKTKWAYTYEEYFEEEQRRRAEKKRTCAHTHLAVICIHCGTHLEETKHQAAKVQVTFL